MKSLLNNLPKLNNSLSYSILSLPFWLALILILFSNLLTSQEQVSQLETYGVGQVTDIGSQMGFAQISGNDYMLVENDSLNIFLWNGGSFELLRTIQPYNCHQRYVSRLDPNRSLFEIRDGKYYRFFRNAFQIIDIASGEVDYLYDGEWDGFERISPVHIIDSRIYFIVWENDLLNYKILDTNTSQFTDLGERPWPMLPQQGDEQLHVEDTSVSIVNLWTGETEHTAIFQDSILHTRLSRSDSSFIIIDKVGKVTRMDSSPLLTEYNCVINDIDLAEDFFFNGERIILVKRTSPSDVTVTVTNLITCEEEERINLFITDEFATNVSFVINESDDEDFTIIGVNGIHPSDAWDPGFFFLIDHVNKRAVGTPEISGVISHTPFRFDDKIYFVGYNSSFWTGSQDVLLKYDMTTGSIKELIPAGDVLSHTALGYLSNGQLFYATNTVNEEVKVWQINEAREFKEVMQPSFIGNAGLSTLTDLKLREDKIYMLTNTGFHSLLNEDETILPFEYNHLLYSIYDDPAEYEMHIIDDKICFAITDEDDHPHFHVYQPATRRMEIYEDSTVTTAPQVIDPAGPLYFYSDGNFGDTLKIFDTRDGSIIEFPDIPYASREIGGTDSAIFWYGSNQVVNKIYSIDYATKNISSHQFEIRKTSYTVSASDGINYLIDYASLSDSVRIRRIKSINDMETIYDGPGRYSAWQDRGFNHDPISSISFFTLTLENDNIRIIADDTQSIEIHDSKFDWDNYHRDPVVALDSNQIILLSNLVTGIQFRVLRAFEDIKPIGTITQRVDFDYADLDGDLSTYFFFDEDDSLMVMTYDFVTEESVTRTIKTDCGFSVIYEAIRIDVNRFLMNGYCNDLTEREPRIVDLRNDSMYVLADINQGPGSSSPGNFLRYKDWIYFTAHLKEGDRQWFRLSTTEETSSLEPVASTSLLRPFPNPTNGMVSLNMNLNSLSVFSIDGKELMRKQKVKALTPIDLTELGKGTFLLMGVDDFGKIQVGKFVKM